MTSAATADSSSSNPPKPLTLKIRIPALKRPPPPPESESDSSDEDDDREEQEPSQSATPEHDETTATTADASGVSTPLPTIRLPPMSATKKKPKPKGRPKLYGRVTTGPRTPAQPGVPRVKRPPKPKPLSEVIPKILAKLRKKDPYGIFLEPVDTKAFPMYLSIVKNPMDMTTMEKKFEAGQYQSLDDFVADFHLMIRNCQAFNPSPSMYHSEASKLEGVGNEIIASFGPHVVPDPPMPLRTPAAITPMEIDTPSVPESKVFVKTHKKVASASLQIPPPPVQEPAAISFAHAEWQKNSQPAYMKQWVRGPYKKTIQRDPVGIGPLGELPGSYNGVGEFPVGSEWGKVVLALEIRGKRYRTKKEKIELEKRGMPTLWDGSIDYANLEDPFSILHKFTENPFQTPPPLWALTQPSDAALDTFPISIPSSRIEGKTAEVASKLSNVLPPHFVQNPNAFVGRRTGKSVGFSELDDIETAQYALPERLALPVDFGVHQTLSQESEERPKATSEEEADAVSYLRDVAYGGLQGLAYARSVLDFVNGATGDGTPNYALKEWIDDNVLEPATGGLHTVLERTASSLHSGVKLKLEDEEDSLSPLLHASLVVDPQTRDRVATAVELRKEKIRLLQLIKEEADLRISDSIWDPEAPVTVLDPNEPNIPVFSAKWASRALKLAADRIDTLGGTGIDPEAEESEEMRRLRLNLLALAKFVPLTQGVQLQ